MTKKEFLFELVMGISDLPDAIVDEYVSFYSEIIDDRIEDGISEEEAVAEIGEPQKIIKQVLADVPLGVLVKAKINPKRRLSALEIALIALGFPVWFPLLIAAISVVFSLYVVIWSIIVSFWAAFVSIAASAIGGIIAGVVFLVISNAYTGVAMLGAGIFLIGISIFAFFGCKYATKGIILLTKKLAVGIKGLFIKRGKNNG